MLRHQGFNHVHCLPVGFQAVSLGAAGGATFSHRREGLATRTYLGELLHVGARQP